MRLISYKNRKENDIQTGLLINDDQELIPLITLGLRSDMNDLIKIDFEEIQKKISLKNVETSKLSLSDVKILSPIPRPLRNIMCVGKNYHDHAQEFYGSGFDSSGKKAVADFPVIFTKATTSVIATNENIVLANDYTNTTDYEGELGIIIGKECRHVTYENANNCIYGFTIVNDFSVRDWQFRGPPHTLTMGKSWDTHCPFGPYIVTSDEIEDPHNLVLKTYVNDEERQNSNTSLMIYDCFTLIEYLSTAFTLMPGDLITTGTPEGVALTTQDWLKPGDNVKVEIDKLGFIQNNIIQEPNNTSKS